MQIQGWMNEIGLHTSLDGVANVRGRLNGRNPDNPAWLMGSHYDTVVDGGFFDGVLGIIAAIAAVKALILEVRPSHLQCVASRMHQAGLSRTESLAVAAVGANRNRKQAQFLRALQVLCYCNSCPVDPKDLDRNVLHILHGVVRCDSVVAVCTATSFKLKHCLFQAAASRLDM